MSWKRLTFILIPHSGEHVRQVRVPRILFFVGLALLTLCVGMMIFYIMGFRALSFQFGKSREISEQNILLENYLQTFDSRISELQLQIAVLESINATIIKESDKSAVDLKLFESSSSLAADGSSISPTRLFEDIAELEYRSHLLDTNLNSVYETLLENSDFLRRLPSIRPADGVISREFGVFTDVITRTERHYPGIDIHNAEGTPVVATADGVVETSRYTDEFGWHIIINHGNGYRTRYSHLQRPTQMKDRSIMPTVRSTVKRGQQIGCMGRTGIILEVVSSHLMYSVLYNGRPVNPANYFFAFEFNPSLIASSHLP